MNSAEPRSVDSHPRKRIEVLGTDISYVDTGRGNPIVFLHGNPTWSYLWRNIIPYVSDLGRCLAPDLVGMGESGKSADGAYRFADHVRYIDAWFEALNLTRNVTLVLHDWGSALGFHRAARFPDQIKMIAYMEAIVKPMRLEEFGQAEGIFRALRSPEGEQMVIVGNFFVEGILPRSVIRTLNEEELTAYRKPFLAPEDRWPTLIWPRQIPIDGEPSDVNAVVQQYSTFMSHSPIPKLLIAGDPGAIIKGSVLEFCKTWPNQKQVTVPGIHFLQEDSAKEIGQALREFVKSASGSSDLSPVSSREAGHVA